MLCVYTINAHIYILMYVHTRERRAEGVVGPIDPRLIGTMRKKNKAEDRAGGGRGDGCGKAR